MSTGVASTMTGSSDDGGAGLSIEGLLDAATNATWALSCRASDTTSSSSAGTIGLGGAARTHGGCGLNGGAGGDAVGLTSGAAAAGGSGSRVSGANEIGANAMSPYGSAPGGVTSTVGSGSVGACGAAGDAPIGASIGAGPVNGEAAAGVGATCSPVESPSRSDGVEVAPSTTDSHDMVGRRRDRSPSGGTIVCSIGTARAELERFPTVGTSAPRSRESGLSRRRCWPPSPGVRRRSTHRRGSSCHRCCAPRPRREAVDA